MQFVFRSLPWLAAWLLHAAPSGLSNASAVLQIRFAVALPFSCLLVRVERVCWIPV